MLMGSWKYPLLTMFSPPPQQLLSAFNNSPAPSQQTIGQTCSSVSTANTWLTWGWHVLTRLRLCTIAYWETLALLPSLSWFVFSLLPDKCTSIATTEWNFASYRLNAQLDLMFMWSLLLLSWFCKRPLRQITHLALSDYFTLAHCVFLWERTWTCLAYAVILIFILSLFLGSAITS